MTDPRRHVRLHIDKDGKVTVGAFPAHFALAAAASAEEAAPSAARTNHDTQAGGAVVYPTPHHIPVRRGVNAEDVEHMIAQVKLCETLFASVVLENAKLYRDAVAAILANHCENAPIGRGARVSSFTYSLEAILEDFSGGLRDLTSDLEHDLERGLED